MLTAVGHKVVDFGNKVYENNDDYPDFAIPLARALWHREMYSAASWCAAAVSERPLPPTKSGASGRHSATMTFPPARA